MQKETKTKIINAFKFLEQMGLTQSEQLRTLSVSNKDQIIEDIVYSNKNVKIKITLFGEKENDVFHAISFSLKNLKAENEVIVMEDYLKFKKNDENLSSLVGESVDDYIIRFSNIVKKEFEGELRDVIEGKTWIDVPVDWGPYK